MKYQSNNLSSKAETKVIAHRGAWKNTALPQNSIAALKAAIKLGVYGSEMDVHMTDDGYLIVNHDPHFHGIEVQNSTLAELRKFKLSNGEQLPLLSDFLKVIAAQRKTKKTRLILEIKISQRGKEWGLQTARKVAEEVAKYRVESLTTYISFGFDICQEILKQSPAARIQYLNGDKSPEEVKAAGLTGIDYHYSVFEKHPEYIAECKKVGIESNAWTVNDSVHMDWLIAHGINMITTDEPEMLFKRIQESPVSKGYHLSWSDEFLYQGLPDPNAWNYQTGGDGWGNREAQYYTKGDTGNAVVRNGLLNITARKEQRGDNKYTSARLTTQGKLSWKYGRIEARLKLPKGVGLWPAFWMLGENIDKVGWPACGEIDIMEHVGYWPDKILGTIHTGAFNHVKGTQKGGETNIAGLYDDFHIYAVEWDSKGIQFFVDNQPYFKFANTYKTVAEWPFDTPFFITLNLAVGGTLGGRDGIDDDAFPASYLVDYVRVYQKE